VLPYTRSAVIGGIFLGLGRALGETMAVTFVIGNAYNLSPSLLEPGTTIASPSPTSSARRSIRMHRSSLLALGFVLFLLTFVVLALAKPDADAKLRRARASERGPSRDRRTPVPRRRLKNALAMTLSFAAAVFGLFWLGWILWTTLSKGVAAMNLACSRDDAAAGRSGRPAQRLLRQRGDQPGWASRSARRSASPPAPGWPSTRIIAASAGGALRQRHPAVGALDRARPVRLHHRGVAEWRLLGLAGACAALAFIALPVVVRTTDEMLRWCRRRCARRRSRSACRNGR
jgi:hypothetical protein